MDNDIREAVITYKEIHSKFIKNELKPLADLAEQYLAVKGVMPEKRSGEEYCHHCGCDLVGLSNGAIDQCTLAATKMQAEITNIKMICDNYDEFGKPVQSDCQLSPLAERVYGIITDATALMKRLEGINPCIDSIQTKFDEWVDCTGVFGGLNTSYYYECVSFFDDVKEKLKDHLLKEG